MQYLYAISLSYSPAHMKSQDFKVYKVFFLLILIHNHFVVTIQKNFLERNGTSVQQQKKTKNAQVCMFFFLTDQMQCL